MDEKELRALLSSVQNGSTDVDDALLKLRMKPFDDIGYAKVDLQRGVRTGTAEVIFGAGKTAEQITGIATSDFIRNIRLKQAARLIRENKVNISQVAYAVGFNSLPHFSTLFKKYYGMSPSEYAEKAKNQE